MTAYLDRIDPDLATALQNARPDFPAKAPVIAALHGINEAEQTMRDTIRALRTALDEAEAALDHTYRHNASAIQRAAAGLDRASTARNIHWAAAATLLTSAELGALHAPISF